MTAQCEICGIAATLKCSGCQRAVYCGKDHQKAHWKVHKTTCKAIQLHNDPRLGRHYRATRDIRQGELILRERPLVMGPKVNSLPVCLGCHKTIYVPIGVRNFYKCSKCKWPLCGKECETAECHLQECALMAERKFIAKIDFDSANPNKREAAYCTILPLRCVLLKCDNPKGFQKITELETHLEKRLDTPTYRILRVNLMMFFRSVLGLDFDEQTILSICAALDTNAFEIRKPDIRIRALYPNAAMLAHNCVANTRHYFGDNNELFFITTVDIKKGDVIYTTYGQALQGTLQRRAHLRQSKYFNCTCERCSDSTELGLFTGSIECPKCYSSKMISEEPLNDDAPWRCASLTCDHKMTAELYSGGQKSLMHEICSLNRESPKEFEGFLSKYRGALHETNSHVLQVKYALTQLYGNCPGHGLGELKETQLERKVDLCKELLEVSEVIEPGLSSFRGFLMVDLYRCKRELLKRYSIKNMLVDERERENRIAEIGELMKQVIATMAFDPNMKVLLDDMMML